MMDIWYGLRSCIEMQFLYNAIFNLNHLSGKLRNSKVNKKMNYAIFMGSQLIWYNTSREMRLKKRNLTFKSQLFIKKELVIEWSFY